MMPLIQPLPLFQAIVRPMKIARRSAESSLIHFTGGFSIESEAEITNATADGVESALNYGYSPTETDSLSIMFHAHNMKIIDAMPWEYLYYYECHRNNTCSTRYFPELTSSQELLNDLTTHLRQEQKNTTIIGYWILDDWNYGDGTGKDLLVRMNSIIHQYTPDKPSICGFGGGLAPLPGAAYSWDDNLADNFSPQGCDMVGLYIYGDSNTTGTYDWTMSGILPAVFTSLKNRGWDIIEEPLVGIPQAFGGIVEGTSWPIPDSQSIETQTKAYCQQGATGIIYYDWGESAQSPLTNPNITQGIKRGIAACRGIWK